MNTILSLVKKDFLLFWKDKTAVVLTFAVPMLLIVIFGIIFMSGDNSGPSGIRLLVVDEVQSEESAELVGFLQREDTFNVLTERNLADGETAPLDRDYAGQLLRTDPGSYRYVLILPENLMDADFGLNFELLYNPQNPVENNIVQGILQKVLFSNAFPLLMNSESYGLTDEMRDSFDDELSEVIARHFGGDPEEIRAQFDADGFWGLGGSSGEGEEGGSGESGSSDALGELFNIEKTQVYGEGKNPASQSVGGWAVMFLLFSLSGAASSLFEEREAGLFLRILSGPATRAQILWSKFFFCGLLGLIQMLVLFTFGHLLYGIITSPAQLLPLLLISIATAAAATAFGMLLASLAQTQAQANGLGTLLILTMSAFGGAMFPLFMMPEFIRTYISPFSLVYWAMDGILAVLWRDAGVLQILPQIGVLCAVAAAILAIALWRFRKGDLFR